MPKSSTDDEPPDTVASSDSVSSRIMLLLSMPETVVRWSLSRCDQRHNFLIVNYANSILVLPLDSICPFQEISGKGLEAESSLRIIDCLCQLKGTASLRVAVQPRFRSQSPHARQPTTK
jgi:hypothetical protein